MKTVKFASHLVPLVLSGAKTSTWRMFDDKDLQVGDELSLVNKETEDEFARARIVHVREKTLGDLSEADYAKKRDTFEPVTERVDSWKKYYGDAVTLDTMVKMVDFELVST